MALLTTEQRKARFKYLGLGEYNKANISRFQKKYLRKKDVDGVYGIDTDRALRHVYNVKKYTRNFSPEEFKCECGGRWCTGYPSYMKRVELENLQSIRNHYGKPIEITSGIRCKKYNDSLRGSSKVSGHLNGYAADIHIGGVTDSLAGRKKLIAYAKKLPNHKYSYCNGWNSNGVKINAKPMGNAVHVESKKPPKSAKKTTAKVAATAAPIPTADPLQRWYDAMTTQYNWSKNQTYAWTEPTIKKSRKKGTCITFPAVSLQRLGIFSSGKYFYFHPKKKRISGNAAAFVKRRTDLFKLSYPNKTIATLWKAGKIQKGDIVGFGNPAYHTMVFMGMVNGKPRFNTMGHKRGLNVTYNSYAKRKVNMLVRLKKTKR